MLFPVSYFGCRNIVSETGSVSVVR